MEVTRTRGDIIINDLKIGDIVWECEYGTCEAFEITTKPEVKDEVWHWKARHCKTDKIIDYSMADANSENGKYNSQFGLKLYSYEAYKQM